jgi:hypothetical protein
MDKGDTVKIKPNFHHPSRVGQTARIIDVRTTGVKHPIQQCFVVFDDGQPDTIYEYDLELIERTIYDEIREGNIPVPPGYNAEPQKRTLDL